MTVADALRRAAAELEAAGVESARVDAEHLVGHALGLTRTQLYAAGARELRADEEARLAPLVARRAAREPLAYVLGEWGFRRLTLRTDSRALVPRPETEVVVERCLELLRGRTEPDVLDVGTGSGAVALALADEHPGARVTAIDLSPDALALARENAERTGLDVRFELADVRDGLAAEAYDLVVSNPPYVLEAELAAAEPEVRDREPRVALLDEGQTEAVAHAALTALRPGGALVLEVGRAGETAALLESLGFSKVTIGLDLAGRQRVVEGVRA